MWRSKTFNANLRKSLAKKRYSTNGNMVKKCVSLDLYGRNVQLTYHGHDKFRTKFGAFCTFLVIVSVLTFAIFSMFDLLSPQPILPLYSKISYKSFYDIYEGFSNIKERDSQSGEIESVSQAVGPMKFFAFGLGEELVNENVGRFIVTQKDENMKVVPCKESNYFDIDRVKSDLGEEKFQALHCLENYNEYVLSYPATSNEASSIEVTFEAC